MGLCRSVCRSSGAREQEERGGGPGVDPRLPRLPNGPSTARGLPKTDVTEKPFYNFSKMLVLLAAAVRAVKAHEESSLETPRGMVRTRADFRREGLPPTKDLASSTLSESLLLAR